MLTLYLIRHGQTAYNAQGRIQGWLDVPLDDVGLWQAQQVAQRFGSKTINAIYTSPLSRARETARAIAAASNHEIILDERLREYHMGDWSGLTGDEINATLPTTHRDGHDIPIPNGETAHAMHERVSTFLHDVATKHQSNEVVVAVSHGGTLGAVLGAMLSLPITRRQPFSFGNTAVTKCSHDHGRWRLRSLNDRCHLREEDR